MMKSVLFFTCILLFTFGFKSQTNCETDFVSDTLTFPGDGKVYEGEYLESTFKNLSSVRLYKTNSGRAFLRMIVTKNFYFDKVGVLEIRSGNRSYYAKNTRQYKISKTAGLFVIEIFKNYVATLREDGITSIIFAEAETDFTRQDANHVKKIAKCFYDAISEKK